MRLLRTAVGEEKVLAVDIWRETVTLRDTEGNRRTVPLDSLKQEFGGPGREGRGRRDAEETPGSENETPAPPPSDDPDPNMN